MEILVLHDRRGRVFRAGAEELAYGEMQKLPVELSIVDAPSIATLPLKKSSTFKCAVNPEKPEFRRVFQNVHADIPNR